MNGAVAPHRAPLPSDRFTAFKGTLDQTQRFVPVIGMDKLLPSPLCLFKLTRLQAIYGLQLGGPNNFAGINVHLKHPDPRRLLGQAKSLLAFPERLLARTDLFRHGTQGVGETLEFFGAC